MCLRTFAESGGYKCTYRWCARDVSERISIDDEKSQNDRYDLRFLWVYFQLLDLCDAASELEIRKTLQNLPQGMTATYTKILEKIATNRANVFLARKMFKWIVCAKRPMVLAELTEAVAFEATDTSWNKEKVLDALRLYQAGGNLVVIDEKDDTVRLAHHTVQQFLVNLPNHQSVIAAPFHFRLEEADVEAGEICVAYLSFSDFERQISTLRPGNTMPVITLPLPAAILDRTTSKLGLNYGVSRLFNFAHYLRTGQYSQGTEKTMNMNFSKFAKLRVEPPQKMREKYLFLNYAIENWIHHTSNLSEDNAETWRLFKKLATNKPLPFDIRPWGDVTDSNAISYTTLLRWAGHAEHSSLIRLVPRDYIVEDQLLLREAMKGQIGLFDFLLMKGFDIETKLNSDGQTALIQAAMEGRAALVDFLLANEADIAASDKNMRTAWGLAVESGHASVVEVLLAKGADINATDDNQRSALNLAVEKGHMGVIELLVAKGADIEAKDKVDGRTALIGAAMHNHTDAVRYLLVNRANVCACDVLGETALHKAARRGYVDTINWLCGHNEITNLWLWGLNELIEQRDNNGLTAICSAASEGQKDVVRCLVGARADYRALDFEEQTPMHWAAIKGHLAVVEFLMTIGAEYELRNFRGQTVLSCAAGSGQAAVVQWLLRQGAEENAKDKDGRSPMSHAVINRHAAVVELFLIQEEVNVNSLGFDDYGRSPLHYAAMNGDVTMVKLLLDHGAYAEEPDSHHKTALDHAIKHRHKAVIEILQAEEIRSMKPSKISKIVAENYSRRILRRTS